MKKSTSPGIALLLLFGISIASLSCGGEADNHSPLDQAEKKTKAAQKGGTITIGEQTWNVIPSRQCGIYPGPTVAISGHSAADPSIEIIIDYDPKSNLKGIRIGPEMGDQTWNAVRSSVKGEVKDKGFSGTANFRRGYAEVSPGKFNIDC